MSSMTDFLSIPSIYLVYFFYGAAFLFLSVSIVMKDMRASDLKLARSLWLLAMFGFTHGVHEWLHMYPLIEGERLTVDAIYLVEAVALIFFVASFLFLLRFGSALIRATHHSRMNWLAWLPAFLVFLWIAFIARHGFTMDLQFLRQAAIGARYTFGLVGGLLTAYGLAAYSHETKHLSRSVSKKLFYVGITFAFYSVIAGVLSSDFPLFLPVPVEILRGICAILIAYFIIKALNIFDIEMRMKFEQQARRIVRAEKLTSLGQLAAGIAHEINNPLTNASLDVQMLSAGLKNGSEDDIPEKLREIEKNIDRASVIARELLQFSRQKESLPRPVNINEILQGTLTLLRHKLKKITVKPNLTPIREVMGDPGKLEQVFINVLSNAVEAMPGGGAIFISSSQLDGEVQVTVTDTGVGIPREHLSRVFDPFFTTKEVGAGTGLGLSICYGIITQHNGTIDIASRKEQGTTVTIKIPFGRET